MCIIVVKKENVAFPNKKILETCFENNPDGAGFMYAYKENVYIKKGFDTFKKFWEALQSVRKECGDNIPFIMHFRISTQAHGRMDCTHPFPLSRNMKDLRELDFKTKMGIAHNGIITLTSTSYYGDYCSGYLGGYSGYSKTITYSDTMKFITDYLSLIIKNNDYYKDPDTIKLISRLADSKLSIMDYKGHIELIGNFIEEKGILYSNGSYKTKKAKVITTTQTNQNNNVKSIKSDTTAKSDYKSYLTSYGYDGGYDGKDDEDDYYENYYDEYEEYYDEETGLYDFDNLSCPLSWDEPYADYYCENCKRFNKCYGIEDLDNEN